MVDGAVMELRIYPSAPEFDDIYFVASMIAALTNPQLFMDLRGMAEAERLAEIATLYAWFEEMSH